MITSILSGLGFGFGALVGGIIGASVSLKMTRWMTSDLNKKSDDYNTRTIELLDQRNEIDREILEVQERIAKSLEAKP